MNQFLHLSHYTVRQNQHTSVLEVNQDNLVSHYVSIIKKRLPALKNMVKYLTADGYFMKDSFITPLLGEGLHIITKMRPDADLRYLYHGPKLKAPGRPSASTSAASGSLGKMSG
ncbi:MAG: hypothetical protein INR73_26740 [Williamsia sp.]|nr:hypothetical protein [Williamsia sp.]